MLVHGEKETMVMAPPTMIGPAVSPCFHSAWCSSTGISHPDLLPHIPSVRLSVVNSSPRPGIAPQSTKSRSQLLSLLWDLCPCLGCVWLWQGLIIIPFRLPQINCFRLINSQPKLFLLWSRQLIPFGDQTPTLVLPPTEGRSRRINIPIPRTPSSFTLSSFVVLYIIFLWSSTPVSSQLVFCTHFCAWRCILDVSVERNILHFQLLFCHFVHLNFLTTRDKTYEHSCARLWVYIFFHTCWYKPKKGIVGSYGNPMFNFWRNFQTLFHHGVLFCISISSAWKFKYFPFFITLLLLYLSLEPYFWCTLHAYLPSVYHYLVNFLFKSFAHFFALVPFIYSVWFLSFSYFIVILFFLNFQLSALIYRKKIFKFYISSVYFATLLKLNLSFSFLFL